MGKNTTIFLPSGKTMIFTRLDERKVVALIYKTRSLWREDRNRYGHIASWNMPKEPGVSRMRYLHVRPAPIERDYDALTLARMAYDAADDNYPPENYARLWALDPQAKKETGLGILLQQVTSGDVLSLLRILEVAFDWSDNIVMTRKAQDWQDEYEQRQQFESEPGSAVPPCVVCGSAGHVGLHCPDWKPVVPTSRSLARIQGVE